MHTITYAYPESGASKQQQQDMANFFYAIGRVIPCVECRKHYFEMLRASPVEMSLGSRAELTHWLIDRHNEVNRRLGKPVVDYAFVDAKFSDMKYKCPSAFGGGSGEGMYGSKKNTASSGRLAERKRILYAEVSANPDKFAQKYAYARECSDTLNVMEKVLFLVGITLFIVLVILIYKSSQSLKPGKTNA
jgi:hypothetical protein